MFQSHHQDDLGAVLARVSLPATAGGGGLLGHLCSVSLVSR